MKKLSGVAVVTTAEGERVSYTYMELDDNGNITSQNNRPPSWLWMRIFWPLSKP